MEIVFTGGGTGGHIFPIIAVAREMRKIYPRQDLKLFYIGPKDDFSLILLGQEDVAIKKILAGKLRRYFSFKNLIDIFKIPIGILQAFFYLFFIAPDVVISKGGYGSFPVVISARILHIPIFLHESDIVPGLASKKTSKWAAEIFTSFPETEFFPKEKIINLGNLVRKEILEGSKEKAKEIFELQGNKPLLLILGGSQGAQRINDIILEILPEILENFEVIHQTGQKNFSEVKAETDAILLKSLKKYYHLLPFLNEEYYKHALVACSLVISRAGAGTIFEIAANGKPSILIPLPDSAQNHQIKNAYAYSKSGSCQVIEQENLKPHFFLEKLKYLFSRPQDLEEMSINSKKFSRPKAAKIIASYLLEYLSPSKQQPEAMTTNLPNK
ncbi:MAG: undecaprenyldiphospho-muramoylpentapeptide beta-N-acetylglucosaminyltransferase [Parcubacteria group bacterium CG2_30_36_21]|uniref:UDP-N-acetylglucosamine--N-acetylmuramyl-(pentapeptide) pyrophosphoryl-undecaprenol N-acetylglucosamine transferase n=1 Tax=bacterium (Candidatus Gribaldobacteria) CG03_land_8_20_14_0_80_36_40 TaxID=2014271 RepID=A0A2M7BZQ1_9BACT|nr:MAG: undecaprenyldiphospho-muramoylpentapeptide beta-N-acetylglucosaminyltransferase [Parcubacteria group bacterium CG2_30_36_21]PIV14195.1 MAG: undecaprenyldiphospho-muramoylpentapeptide beta-N-acetylglucosaminyltransferase [bacterium (Candidatus Gribaldobacteria) CG03_land_8_20_14_0_80_36_40]